MDSSNDSFFITFYIPEHIRQTDTNLLASFPGQLRF